MSELQKFINKDFGEIRGININGIAWLIGKDVANQLGYTNTKDALIRHVEDDDKQILQRSQNTTLEIPNRGITIINESGFYSMVFGSKLPKAKEFKHWVTSEVLPQIRQTGGYVQEDRESEFIDNYFPSFTDSTKLAMVQDLKKQNEEYKNQISRLTPQAEAYQDLMTAQGYIKFIDLAQSIEIGRTKLFDFLRKNKILTKQSNFNVPYGRFTKNGCFKVLHNKNDKGHYTMVTMVSPKGTNYIYKLIKKNNLENEFDTEKLLSATVSKRTVA